MIDKIKTINNFKLLARLYLLSVKKKQHHNPEVIDNIIANFKVSYPNIGITYLKETYEIPNGDSTFLQIREYSYPEYETKYHDGYEELLTLSMLCSKYLGYSPFRTMIGEIYYSVDDFNNAYEVIFIQEKYGSEQLFVLLNKKHNNVITAKVSEWRCGKLSGESNLFTNRDRMINAYEMEALKKYKDVVERAERLRKSPNATY